MRDASVDDGSPLVGDDSPLINDESTETFEDTSTSHLRQKGNLIRSPSKKAKVGGSPPLTNENFVRGWKDEDAERFQEIFGFNSQIFCIAR